MIKPVYAIYEQQRHRSACASVQSDQHLCCSLLKQHNASTRYKRNSKTLASLCSLVHVGQFESYRVQPHEDRFSRDKAHIINKLSQCTVYGCSEYVQLTRFFFK